MRLRTSAMTNPAASPMAMPPAAAATKRYPASQTEKVSPMAAPIASL